MGEEYYDSPDSDYDDGDYEDEFLASRVSRFCAVFLDSFIIMFVTLPLMFFTGGFDFILHGAPPPSLLYNLEIGGAGVLLFMMVHGHFLLARGQTLGKMALGIKIVTLDGNLPNANQLIKRYAVYMLPGNVPVIGGFFSLVNVLFIFRQDQRCIHDLFADTKVVRVQ